MVKRMNRQLTLANEKIDTENLIPLTIEIEFIIKEGSLWWNGKAYPHVSSGCMFGGVISYEGKEQIDWLVNSERCWFKASYGRPIKEKITIIDERAKEKQVEL